MEQLIMSIVMIVIGSALGSAIAMFIVIPVIEYWMERSRYDD